MPILISNLVPNLTMEFKNIGEAFLTAGTFVPLGASSVPENGWITYKSQQYPFNRNDYESFMEEIEKLEKMGIAHAMKAMKVMKKPVAMKAMKVMKKKKAKGNGSFNAYGSEGPTGTFLK